jgi:hypothetical protein
MNHRRAMLLIVNAVRISLFSARRVHVKNARRNSTQFGRELDAFFRLHIKNSFSPWREELHDVRPLTPPLLLLPPPLLVPPRVVVGKLRLGGRERGRRPKEMVLIR